MGSLIECLESHELATAAKLLAVDVEGPGTGLGSTLGTLAHRFQARPPFNSGALVFTPPVLTAEVSMTPEQLSASFSATNDGVIAAAEGFWTSFASQMASAATAITSLAGRLTTENQGAVFAAAAAQLTALATRVAAVSESAGILAGHLAPLPGIRATAVAQIDGIIAETAAIEDPVAREAVAHSQAQAYLATEYLPQLHAATPRLTSLTVPKHGNAGALAVSGTLGGPPSASGIDYDITGSGAMGPVTASAAAAPTATTTVTEATPAGMEAPAGTAPSAATPVTSQSSIPNIAGPGATSPAPTTSGTPAGAGGHAIPNLGGNPAATGASGGSVAAPTSTAGYQGIRPAGPTGGEGGRPAAGVGGTGAPTHRLTRGRPGLSPYPGLGKGLGAGPVSGIRGVPGLGPVAGPGASYGGGGVPRGGAGIPVTGTGGATGGARAAATPALGTGAGGPGSGTHTAGVMRGPMAAGAMAGRGAEQDSVNAIRREPQKCEQDEYQEELFGAQPVTVPGVIGANVKG
ncbi:hypothetical protein [Corynebacterium sphenisci]|uniref:hypothetical protein n=1 Tax=Corynebacterium sphenisci TaxID=191493 RepID=UPI0026DFAEA7|nr:hypothetical protein [Corynebacterium sphenisci]MDO5731315.1 hypothetical protein [Corynebacterium sphenisci]